MVPFSFKLEICLEGNMEIATIIFVFNINDKRMSLEVFHSWDALGNSAHPPLPSDYLVFIYWDHYRNQPLIWEHLAQGTCNGLQRSAHHVSHADEVAIWWIFSN